MKLHVAEGVKRVGETFPFELTLRLEPQSFGGQTLVFAEPARILGEYVFDGKAFMLTAEVQVALACECARCLKPMTERISFSMEERFAREAASDEDESYPYQGDTLDLEKPFMDNLYLNLPLVSVCRADCAGLCPVCGADRNTTECGCMRSDS